MRPLVDAYDISRVKLAFLLDAMAASLCVLIPATSWVAMILVQLQVSGISEQAIFNPLIKVDPYIAYLAMMPFLFYPALSVLTAWFLVGSGIRWGLMARYENRGALHEMVNVAAFEQAEEGSLIDFALPLSTFLLSLALGIGISGKYYLFGGNNSFFEALQQADIFATLFFSSLSAVSAALGWYFLVKNNKPGMMVHALKGALALMKNSLILLSLAWTLSSFFRNDLQAGQQLAHYLELVPFKQGIPSIIFLLAAGISAITGTAWGTISLLFPLVVPLITTLNKDIAQATLFALPLLLPSLAAVISGSIAGGHISPIADSACMSALSAGVPLLEHIQTQQQYVLSAFFATALAYLLVVVLPFSLSINVSISWVIALVCVFSVHYYRSKIPQS